MALSSDGSSVLSAEAVQHQNPNTTYGGGEEDCTYGLSGGKRLPSSWFNIFGACRCNWSVTGGRQAVLETLSVAVLKERRSFSPRTEDDFNSVFKGGGGGLNTHGSVCEPVLLRTARVTSPTQCRGTTRDELEVPFRERGTSGVICFVG